MSRICYITGGSINAPASIRSDSSRSALRGSTDDYVILSPTRAELQLPSDFFVLVRVTHSRTQHGWADLSLHHMPNDHGPLL